ncbi:hypothetical protein [Asticcacaulis benevestitus]|uniref:Uncharacterized protein n=1 Tax=Asticcacaulis benevestitus DSM 16100 = ATCC BAA-896 TaxID=1121022 RepID=V4P1E7_9CAUL|nr:hypothetical protein [Asticcacaulis benevestitus]ESQ87817.1 hypothetical protein ABENE_16830 [Asticcacaulis benevestitus DSM 16100 = ATCC BAA-896]
MALNPEFVFQQKYISIPLKRALGLPDDVWSLVLNDSLDSAYFLNGDFRPQTIALKPDVRPLVDLALRQKREAELALPRELRPRYLAEVG